MANARGSDPGAFRVEPQKIAKDIVLSKENERLRKENAALKASLKKKFNGRGWGGTADENIVVQIIRGSEVEPKPINWLWDGWLAGGKMQILAGAKATLKTTIAIDWAARITAGRPWPDGTPAPCGDALIWSGEDDFADTILPRFLAAGGDRTRLRYVKDTFVDGKPRPFDPAHDMQGLMAKVENIKDLKFVTIDSIVSVVAGDSHKNAEVRRALSPLVYYAAERGCCVLGLTHFTKGTAGNDPVERVTGSLAFGALGRLVLVTGKPIAIDGKRRLLRAASNIGPDGGGFEYSGYQEPLADYPFPAQRIAWGAQLEGEARELLNDVELPRNNEPAPRLSAASQFLKSMLADGPVPVAKLREEANAAGHSWATIRRAGDELGVTSEKDGFQVGWAWRLPNDLAPGREIDI